MFDLATCWIKHQMMQQLSTLSAKTVFKDLCVCVCACVCVCVITDSSSVQGKDTG